MLFFIKYRTDQGYVEVECCPTEEMWAYMLNKSNDGKDFRVQGRADVHVHKLW